MKKLVLAEKPSVARDLARVLGKIPKKEDFFENDEWIIDSAVGHLVELFMPDDFDKKLKAKGLKDLDSVLAGDKDAATGAKARAAETKPRRTGLEPLWSDNYFVIPDNDPSEGKLIIHIRKNYAVERSEVGLGKVNMSKLLPPNSGGSERSLRSRCSCFARGRIGAVTS